MNLYDRFVTLKKQVGGNWEKKAFVFSFGPSVAERNGITEPSVHIRRILSQLQFALQLSEKHHGRYEQEICCALAVLETCMEQEGVLTKTACLQAEEQLLPLSEEAKTYDVIFAAHAHMDMNWMWGWQETVAITLSTCRTILNLMQEYPGFTFSQSQASVYRIVEEHDPDMMEQIKARIREGRWEVTANAWVETDKNMPDTESLLRHIRLTQDYLKETWGINPDDLLVDFSPDTFGHSRFVPEINNFGNVPYYYHCRGLQDDLTLYRFRAPSGKEVLAYKEPYWYNSGTNPDNGTGVIEMERRCAGLKTSLIVYGVGNHGGGPTRRDIENILLMQQWPVFPKLRFGTLREYFQIAESIREKLPVIDHEMNAIFTGCYTTQSRIKLANRRAEAALLDSERISAMSHMILGTPFAAKRYEKAWQKVLFTHFHDILTGSCVQESREYAMGILSEAIAYAQTEQSKAYETLSRALDTSMFPTDGNIRDTRSEGAGVGFGLGSYAGVPNPERGAGKTRIYTVFNTSPYPRREPVMVTLWDYSGDWNRLEAVDHENKPVILQILDDEPQWYWDHYYIRVLIHTDVPPMGYAVYALREKEVTAYPTHLLYAEREEKPKGPIVLENAHLYARFDTGNGMLVSLVDKASGQELLHAPAGLYLIRTEDAGMTAWRIGRYLDMMPITATNQVKVESGPLRSSVTFRQQVMSSTVQLTVVLDKDAFALRYELEVDWHEARCKQEYIPLLAFRLPLRKGSDILLRDVPAGFACRDAEQIDVPALTGACAMVDDTTAALLCDCKYGFRLYDNVLSTTLINTSAHPDPYPERGIHRIQLFVALTKAEGKSLKRLSEQLTRPMTGVPTASHPGSLPAKASLLDADTPHSVLSSVSVCADGALSVRVFEAVGEEDTITLQLPFTPTRAVCTDLQEHVLAEAELCGNTVRFRVAPYSIAQVNIQA